MATSSTDLPFPHELEEAAWANGPEDWHSSFRLKSADLVIIRRQRTATSRLGLALQLGCVRQFGAFVGDLTLLPGEVLRRVASEIDIADSREALAGYRRSAAAARHRALVRAHLGFRELGQPEVALGITRWLLGRVWHRDERPEVLQELLVARLRREKVLLPAVNTLERLVARCRARMERRLWRRLASLPSPDEAMRLENLLSAGEDAPLSNALEQLRRGPQRVSSEGLLEAIERLETVRTVGGETWDLGEIPSIRLSRLAGEVDFTSGWDLRRMTRIRRLAVLVAYVHRLRQQAQDDVLSILDLHLRMVMSRLQRKERRERLRTRTELNHAARDLALACAPLIDPAVEDAEVRKAAWLRVSKPRIQAAMVSVAELAVEGDQGLARLAGRNAELRRFLPRLLAVLRLEANASGRGVLEAWRYLHRIEGKRRPDLGMAPTDFLRGQWKGLVWNSDGTLDRGLYSWAVLDHLRDALRRRDVFAPESRDHRDPRRQLLSGRQWRARRGAILRTLDLPESWAAALEDLSQDLLRAYWRADAVLDRPGGPHLVDTAGYSDVVFGLFWLLGFQFSPRLRDLSDVRFWRLGPSAELKRMQALSPRKIRPDRIESHWEDLLRIAGSLQQGQVRASDFMRSLQAGGRVSRLRQAIVELGRIVKTIYLLGYLADAEERRRVLTQLNRGESRHALARTIFFGRRGELRQTYRPGQEDQLGALGLVVNAVIHWNAVYTSEVLSAMARLGRTTDPGDVARLSPLVHGHIQLLGRYRFELPTPLSQGDYRQVTVPPG